jgi:TonB family protein
MAYLFAVACLFLLAPAATAQAEEPLRVGNGVSPPQLLNKVEPEYSEEARKARLSGAVVLYVVIRPDGHASGMRVIRSLGLGLDENAMTAVTQWAFQPGEKEGRKVSVAATIEVNFRLLPNHGFEPGWHTQRVVFQNADGVTRPSLLFAKFPPNGDPPEHGTVTVSCVIDEQGAPTALRVEKSTAPSLDADAMAMLREWRFSPAMKDGKPAAVGATIDVSFGSVAAPKTPAAPVTKL